MTTPATGLMARSISEAVCIMSMMVMPLVSSCCATSGTMCARLVKAATPEPVRAVMTPITAERTTPEPVTPRPTSLAASMRMDTMPTFCRPFAKKAATKMSPTVLVKRLPIPLNIAKERSKEVRGSRRTTRSIKKATIQERNMAVATFKVTSA